MKKGLSVLLIVAALFGFYGGAANIQDVLAAKQYWENKSKQTTADLNKLEDGLKTLDENKEAYLDGLDKVADGEKALADGEAELAQGEADYAAAPGKLADARRQIAQGEEDLAEGLESLNKLKTAIGGVNQILSGYNDTWRPKYEDLKSARKDLHSGVNGAKGDLKDLAAFLPSGQKTYLAALEEVAEDSEKQTANSYKDFIKNTNQLAKDLPKIQKNVKDTYNGASALLSALKAQKDNLGFAKVVSAKKTELLALAPLIEKANGKDAADAYKSTINAVADAIENKYPAAIEANTNEQCNAKNDEASAAAGVTVTNLQAAEAQAAIKAGLATDMASALEFVLNPANKEIVEGNLAGPAKAGIKAKVEEGVNDDFNSAEGEAGASLTKAKVGLTSQYNKEGDGGVLGIVVASLKTINEKVNGDNSKLKNKLLPGLQKFNKQVTNKGIDALTDGQNTIAGGIATIASGVLNNSTLKAGVRKAMGNKAITLLRRYSGKSSPAYTKNSNFAKFEKQMDSNPGLVSMLLKARKFLGNTRSDGLKTYNAGVKKLAAGKAQYAQGLKDYEAAPGKLEEGRQKLADGRKELAAGKEKLAEYEDGEQQVRDGLATLMASDRYADLETILERRNGDDNFDAADKSLDIPEGLEAVGTGREYQADTGEIVTSELTGRILGSGIGLGAAAIAVLAAALSLLKKYKGAAISAIGTAAAGIAGIVAGNNAGMEMSSIAGSTIGATPMIAAGILAAVAAVFSIVHFTAKKDA